VLLKGGQLYGLLSLSDQAYRLFMFGVDTIEPGYGVMERRAGEELN